MACACVYKLNWKFMKIVTVMEVQSEKYILSNRYPDEENRKYVESKQNKTKEKTRNESTLEIWNMEHALHLT